MAADNELALARRLVHNRVAELELQGTFLRVVPASACSVTALETLNLSHNSLETLPFEMSRLARLTALDVSFNRLRGE